MTVLGDDEVSLNQGLNDSQVQGKEEKGAMLFCIHKEVLYPLATQKMAPSQQHDII